MKSTVQPLRREETHLWRTDHCPSSRPGRPGSRAGRLSGCLRADTPQSYSGSCCLGTLGTHTDRSVRGGDPSYTEVVCEGLLDLLLQHISSLRSPQSSTPSQVCSKDTHLLLTHLKPPHCSPGTADEAEVESVPSVRSSSTSVKL